jgi:hypothetical protein
VANIGMSRLAALILIVRPLCLRNETRRADNGARQTIRLTGRHCSGFITLKLFVLRPGKAVLNAPKCRYSRLYRAGVFVFVVSQSI